MSWSRLLIVVAVVALGPVGCGFRPMYGSAAPNAGVASDLGAIRVLAIEDRLGQQMRNALVQRVTPSGEPAAARYNLTVRLTEVLEGLGHQKDAKATLGRLTLTATYSLSDAEGRSLTSGNTRSLVSFNYLGPRYASISTERDAQERALTEVAEEIRRRLAVYFTNPEGAAR